MTGQPMVHEVPGVKHDLIHVFAELVVFRPGTQAIIAEPDFNVRPRTRIALSVAHESVAVGALDLPEMLRENPADLIETVCYEGRFVHGKERYVLDWGGYSISSSSVRLPT